MTRLILLGPPGAGKGTQAQILADILNLPHISTGELIREAMDLGTPLGQTAQSYVAKGELVPNGLLLDLVRERLSQPDAHKGWILDGFPRTLSQAHFLQTLLQELNQECDCINVDVPDEVVVTRMMGRGRKDDTPEAIRKRLEVYREETKPVIDFYSERSALKVINGNRTLEEVTESLKQIIVP